MTRIVLASIVLMIAGCSGGLRSDDPPVQVYILRSAASPTTAAREQAEALDSARAAATTPGASAATTPPTLQLPCPQAVPGLSSDQIVLVRSDHRMVRFSGSSWPGALPDVVSTLAIDTLRASGAWAAVHD